MVTMAKIVLTKGMWFTYKAIPSET